MATGKQYYTLNRDPESPEWDTCPRCQEAMEYRGDDEHRDDYDRYAFFVCDNSECGALEAVIRHKYQ